MSGLEQIKCAKCGRPHEEGERMEDGCCLACPQPVVETCPKCKVPMVQLSTGSGLWHCTTYECDIKSRRAAPIRACNAPDCFKPLAPDWPNDRCEEHSVLGNPPLRQRHDGLPIHENMPCDRTLFTQDERDADLAARRMVERNPDPVVNHPKHYNMGTFEVIDVIEDWGLGFNLGNAIKYIARAPHKGCQAEDLKKAAWYLQRAISRLEAP